MRPDTCAVVLVAVLAGCGGSPSGPGGCTPAAPSLPALPAPVASAGPVSVTADRTRVDAGGTVDFTVTVTGPAHFAAACTGPVQLAVTDAAGLHVFATAPAAPRGTPCGKIILAVGVGARYALQWQPDPTLPRGPYLAVFSAGDLPQVSVRVILGAAPGVGTAGTCAA